MTTDSKPTQRPEADIWGEMIPRSDVCEAIYNALMQAQYAAFERWKARLRALAREIDENVAPGEMLMRDQIRRHARELRRLTAHHFDTRGRRRRKAAARPAPAKVARPKLPAPGTFFRTLGPEYVHYPATLRLVGYPVTASRYRSNWGRGPWVYQVTRLDDDPGSGYKFWRWYPAERLTAHRTVEGAIADYVAAPEAWRAENPGIE